MPMQEKNRTSGAISAFFPFSFAARDGSDSDVRAKHRAEKHAERTKRKKRNIHFDRENKRKQ